MAVGQGRFAVSWGHSLVYANPEASGNWKAIGKFNDVPAIRRAVDRWLCEPGRIVGDTIRFTRPCAGINRIAVFMILSLDAKKPILRIS